MGVRFMNSLQDFTFWRAYLLAGPLQPFVPTGTLKIKIPCVLLRTLRIAVKAAPLPLLKYWHLRYLDQV